MQDLLARASLHGAALPSVCMYTFLNARDGLNCGTVSRDAACVAAGFADSTVSVWRVDGSGFDVPKTLLDTAPSVGVGTDPRLLVFQWVIFNG